MRLYAEWGNSASEALHLLLFECEMASVFKACQQSVTSHGEFIMARVVKLFIRPAVNNEPCQLIGDSTSPSQMAEKKPKEVTIDGNAPFGLCVLPNTPRKTTISLFFFSSPLFSFSPIPPRYVSTFPPTRRLYRFELSGQVQTAGGKRNTFSFACFYILHVQIHISFFKQLED